MTLEELIEDYRDQERKYSEASNQAGNSLQRMKWLGRRIAAQVALAPGAKVYHGPNRIVYAPTDDGNLSVIETMRSTASGMPSSGRKAEGGCTSLVWICAMTPR